MPELFMTYQSHLDSEGQMYDDVKSFLTGLDIHEKLTYNIMLAVSEAFTNALVHGNKFDEDKSIEIHLRAKAQIISADIIDEGNCEIDLRQINVKPDPDSEGGRGLDLIKNLSDSACWIKDEKSGGIRVQLTFNLAHRQETKEILL